MIPANQKILIVDDDPAGRKTLQDILTLKGYQAFTCSQGEESIREVHSQSFNLVVIDLKLPDMPGLEVMSAIKNIAPETECIVLTGFASQASAIEAVELGAYSYMQKPYDVDRLLLTIQHALERQQTRWNLRKRATEISQLYEAAQQLGVTLNLDQVYERIYRVISDNMPCDSLIISSYSEQEELVYCQRCWSDGVQVDIRDFPPVPLNKAGKGVQSKVILSGQPQYLPDYLAERKTSPTFYYFDQEGVQKEAEIPADRPLTQSAILAPIKLEDRVIGVIQVGSNRPDNYSDDHLRFLEALTPMIAIAIANAQLHAQVQKELEHRIRSDVEVKRQADEFAALYETSQLLSSKQDLPSLIQAIVESAARLLHAPSAYIYLYDPQQRLLSLDYEIGMPELKGVHLRPDQGAAGWVLRENKPLIIEDYSRWPERVTEFDRYGYVSVINVPINFAAEPIGVLGVQDKQRKVFTQDHARLLTLFAAQAASAIHNARLLEETKRQAAQLSLLYDAGLALNSLLEPAAQLEFLFKIAMDTLNAERASFFRYFPMETALKFELGIGYSAEALAELKTITHPVDEAKSLSGWVAINRLPLNISDLDSDERYLPIDPQLKSGLFVPVEREKQLRGVLAVFSTRPNAFDPYAERLLLLFANQAAVAMENAQLLGQTRRQLASLRALHNIDLAITASTSLGITLNILLEQARHALEMDAAEILLFDSNSLVFKSAASIGVQNISLQPAAGIRAEEGIIGKVVRERKSAGIPELRAAEELTRREQMLLAAGFGSYFVFPMISKGELKGIIEILHRKSFHPDEDWLDSITQIGSQAAIAIENATLFENLHRSNTELSLAYETTLKGWASALELRDLETEGHSQRVADMTVKLGDVLGVSQADIIHLRRGALLHDVGKMGIPDSILLKPATLTEDEWKIMKMHPVHAYNLLLPIAYLQPAIDIPYLHHEKWDGSGYPLGLKGDQIPLAARIFAVIDVWDALLSDRPYRKAWSRKKALAYIQKQSGKHFDPRVVDAFLKLVSDLP